MILFYDLRNQNQTKQIEGKFWKVETAANISFSQPPPPEGHLCKQTINRNVDKK